MNIYQPYSNRYLDYRKKEVKEIFEKHLILFCEFKDERIHFEYYPPGMQEAMRVRIALNEDIEIDKKIIQETLIMIPCFHCKHHGMLREIWAREKGGFRRIREIGDNWREPFPGFIELIKKSSVKKDKKHEIVREERKGYVYFLLWQERNLVKIGNSNNPKRRTMEIKTQIFGTTTLLKVVETENPSREEKEYHKKFHHLKVKGEWFKYDDNLKNFIEKL